MVMRVTTQCRNVPRQVQSTPARAMPLSARASCASNLRRRHAQPLEAEPLSSRSMPRPRRSPTGPGSGGCSTVEGRWSGWVSNAGRPTGCYWGTARPSTANRMATGIPCPRPRHVCGERKHPERIRRPQRRVPAVPEVRAFPPSRQSLAEASPCWPSPPTVLLETHKHGACSNPAFLSQRRVPSVRDSGAERLPRAARVGAGWPYSSFFQRICEKSLIGAPTRPTIRLCRRHTNRP